MTYKRFDRDEIFNSMSVSAHMDLIRDIEDFLYETTGDWGFDTPLRNMLCGIWDGFLYDELLSEAEINLSQSLYSRVEDTVDYINNNATFITEK